MRPTLKFISLCAAWAVLLTSGFLRAAELPARPEKLTPAQAVDAYLAVVEDEQQTRVKRSYAAAQIVKLGESALPRIQELYRRADVERRGCLAEILSGMGKVGRTATDMLLDDLKRSRLKTHPNVIRAMGDLQIRDAVPLLLELLSAASDQTRSMTLYALSQLADERASDALSGALDAPDRVVRAVAANGVIGLLVKLKAKTPEPEGQDAYHTLLKKVLRYIESGNQSDVKRILAAGMGRVKEPESGRILRRNLRYGSPELQLACARALGELGDREAVRELTETLSSDDLALRRAALEALASIGDLDCVPVLIDRLETSEAKERRDLVKALNRLTGQVFGDNPQQWRQWWESRENAEEKDAGARRRGR